MTNAAHVHLVHAVYDSFLTGNVETFVGLFTEDAVLELPAMPGIPWRSSYVGREGLLEFFTSRGPLITYTAFEPREFFTDQSSVIILGRTAGLVRTTGRTFEAEWVQVLDISPENRVRRFREYTDTHALVSAFTPG